MVLASSVVFWAISSAVTSTASMSALRAWRAWRALQVQPARCPAHREPARQVDRALPVPAGDERVEGGNVRGSERRRAAGERPCPEDAGADRLRLTFESRYVQRR